MALIVPKFNSAVDAAVHADKHNLRDFVIQRAEDGFFAIYLLSGEHLIPYTIDDSKETVCPRNFAR